MHFDQRNNFFKKSKMGLTSVLKYGTCLTRELPEVSGAGDGGSVDPSRANEGPAGSACRFRFLAGFSAARAAFPSGGSLVSKHWLLQTA